MIDKISQIMPWLDDIMTNPENSNMVVEKQKKSIVLELKERWKTSIKINLFNELSEKYGEKDLLETLEKISLENTSMYWKYLADNSPNLSFEEFYKKLWADLPGQGFDFTQKNNGNRIEFTVTRCPLADLARELKAEKLIYCLSCATDPIAIESFNPEIRFERDKTLMEGDSFCNHTYIIPE